MALTVGAREPSVRQSPQEAPAGPRNRALVLGVVGVALAGLLLGLGAVMRDNADFAKDNVSRQLAEQRIRFSAVDALAPEERATPCLVRWAGQPLTTGPQAECYANQFIGRHLKAVAEGRTYGEMREVQTSLRARIAEAQAKGDPAVADLQRQLTEATGKRQTLFEGETTRGLLLTSYGFSTLGAKAEQAASVSFVAGGALLLLSAAVLLRAVTRRSGRPAGLSPRA